MDLASSSSSATFFERAIRDSSACAIRSSTFADWRRRRPEWGRSPEAEADVREDISRRREEEREEEDGWEGGGGGGGGELPTPYDDDDDDALLLPPTSLSPLPPFPPTTFPPLAFPPAFTSALTLSSLAASRLLLLRRDDFRFSERRWDSRGVRVFGMTRGDEG